jgi:hypothetical protein
MGRAFCEYVERYPHTLLPKAGGLAATIVVTMAHEALTGALKAACLDTGEAISPGLARRLACEAAIIPMVLGGESEILDEGRAERFHKPHQRLAVGVRDKTCTAQGCDWPPWMCHVHHDTPFSKGGPTSVDDARLLCPRHHARAHDPAYATTKLPGGKVAFHRRT